MNEFSKVPKVYPAPGWERDGIKPLFYEGPDYKGKSTRIFAYLGIPEVKDGKKVPGMVLVHGGTGTAFEQWVKIWTERGYAAISMDTEGKMPSGKMDANVKHDWAGPDIGTDCFEPNIGILKDHWSYHAVAAVILGHSLLRSQPEVDPNNIGITGISWGGYKTCIAADIDKRFKCAIPVYGCGFLDKDSPWTPQIQQYGREKWLTYWDPSAYLGDVEIPMLWVNGTNDASYHLDSYQQSYRKAKGTRTLCIRVGMNHSHPDGWEPNEIYVFADSILRGGAPLAKFTGQGHDGNRVWADFNSNFPVVKAELNFTKDSGTWPERKWRIKPAEIDSEKGRISVVLPEGVTIYYLNLTDNRNLVISTEHVELANAN